VVGLGMWRRQRRYAGVREVSHIFEEVRCRIKSQRGVSVNCTFRHEGVF